MSTVGQLIDHYARAHVRDQGFRPPLTLPEIWVDQPTGAYVSPPMGVRQHEPTDPQMAAAFAAADARYGR